MADFQTVTFKSVLDAVASRIGLEAGTLQTTQANALAEYIDSRVREGWEAFQWPELTIIELRGFCDGWDATATYASGDTVWSPEEEAPFQAADIPTVDVGPPAEPWIELTSWEDTAPVVALAQGNFLPIGDVLNAWDADPRTDANAGPLRFEVRGDGILFPVDSTRLSVWLEYRVRPSNFTATPWSGSATYSEGDRVYYSTTGECYEALESVSAGTLPTNTRKWCLQRIPYRIAEYVKRGAVADALREEGQTARANAMEARAFAAIEAEMHRCVVQTPFQGERISVQVRA